MQPVGMSSTHRPPAATIFIGNIPYDVTEQMLMEVFQEVGPVKSLRLVNDRDTGKPKGYGFCEYYDVPTAESAMRNLNGFEVNGRSLRVDYADEHQAREGRGPKDTFRPPGPGPTSGGLKQVGHQAASTAAQQMVMILGGTPGGAAGASQEKINSTIGGKSPAELYEIMAQMKTLVQQNPAAARQLLTTNPQLVKSLFQAQIVLGMVKAPPVPPQPAQPPPTAQSPYNSTSQTPPAAASGNVPPPPPQYPSGVSMPVGPPHEASAHMPLNQPLSYPPSMQPGYPPPTGSMMSYGHPPPQMPPGMLAPPQGGQGYMDHMAPPGAYPGVQGPGMPMPMQQMPPGGMMHMGGQMPMGMPTGAPGTIQQHQTAPLQPQQPSHLQQPPMQPPQQPQQPPPAPHHSIPSQPMQQPQQPQQQMYGGQQMQAPDHTSHHTTPPVAAAPAPALAAPAPLDPAQQVMLAQVMKMSEEQVNSLSDPMRSQIIALRERARALGIMG